MNLLPPEVQCFYRVLRALLAYTNEQRHVLPNLNSRAVLSGAFSASEGRKLGDALWADNSLLESFIAQNPAHLSPQELDIATGWQHRVAGDFVVVRHLKAYTVFLASREPRAYGVVGLLTPLSELLRWPLPALVRGVLLPFGDRITYDGVLTTHSILFGPGVRRGLNSSYRRAKERWGIITSLLPPKTPPSREQVCRDVRARNARVLDVFRRELYGSRLSTEAADRHIAVARAFASEYLPAMDPPRLLVNVTAADVRAYLTDRPPREARGILRSLERLVRFLYDSERMDPDIAEPLLALLSSYRRGVAGLA